MRKVLIFFIFSYPIITFSQTSKDTIFSQKLKEDREFTISLPESYGTNKTKKYPILLLLDGDYLFDPFHGALKYGAYWDDIPEVIIVGISQNQKDERYTDCGVDPESGLPDAKGELFYEFISQELMPFLEKSYRIAPFKIIAGHDVTAGFLNFYLYKDQLLFNAYISLSPKFPVSMEETIPERLAALNQPLFYYQATAGGDLKSNKDRIIQLDSLASEIKKHYPDKILAYNCSPSFNWTDKFTDIEITNFQKNLSEFGYRLQFVSLAGFHSMSSSMYNLANNYKGGNMKAIVDLQEYELELSKEGYTAIKHQQEVGGDYFESIGEIVMGNDSDLLSKKNSTEETQF